MRGRSPGLQGRWAYVVNSLQAIIPSYELASSRISLFADRRMRAEAVRFAVRKGSLVLDLGAGPGTMARVVSEAGGEPVLLDVSRAMLKSSSFRNRVLATFEDLPFRPGSFEAVVSGFALRDSRDLEAAIAKVAAVLRRGGRFAFCDLGKSDSGPSRLLVGVYLRVAPNLIGLLTAGRDGLKYGSIYDTYLLVLTNSSLKLTLGRYFESVDLTESRAGSSIVVRCIR